MFYIFVIIAAVAIAVLTPRPEIPKPTPAGLDDIGAPTAEEGREIPVLFGTRDIRGINVVWYGDLVTIPIKSKGGKK